MIRTSLFSALALALLSLGLSAPANAQSDATQVPPRVLGSGSEFGVLSMWWSPKTGYAYIAAASSAGDAQRRAKARCGRDDCEEITTVTDSGYAGVATYVAPGGENAYVASWAQRSMGALRDHLDAEAKESGWGHRKDFLWAYVSK